MQGISQQKLRRITKPLRSTRQQLCRYNPFPVRLLRNPRLAGLLCLLAMAVAIAVVSQIELYLARGGAREHLAGLIEEAALFALFLAAGVLVLIALLVAWHETSLRCLHYAVGSLGALGGTLVLALAMGFSMHSWKASLVVPATTLALVFVIFLGAAGLRSRRQH